MSSLFPEPEHKEAEVPTYWDLMHSEVESNSEEFIDRDAGDYGYGGEWFTTPQIDSYKITDFVIKKLEEFAKQKGVSFP
jgi:hypothetical protein